MKCNSFVGNSFECGSGEKVVYVFTGTSYKLAPTKVVSYWIKVRDFNII